MQDDIDKMLENQYNEQYRTETGAEVDYLSAISLVNRYCDVLPSDQFTMPTVTWRRVDKSNGNCVVCLQLPIQSPISYEIFVSTRSFFVVRMMLIGIPFLGERIARHKIGKT